MKKFEIDLQKELNKFYKPVLMIGEGYCYIYEFDGSLPDSPHFAGFLPAEVESLNPELIIDLCHGLQIDHGSAVVDGYNGFYYYRTSFGKAYVKDLVCFAG